MLFQYMKKHRWVIIILLIAVASIIYLWFAIQSTPDNEREFQGIFIHTREGAAGGHLYKTHEKSQYIRTTGHFSAGCS